MSESRNDFIKAKPGKRIGRAVGPDGELLPESDADFIRSKPSKNISGDLDSDETPLIKSKPSKSIPLPSEENESDSDFIETKPGKKPGEAPDPPKSGDEP